jgi:hypothetical protein
MRGPVSRSRPCLAELSAPSALVRRAGGVSSLHPDALGVGDVLVIEAW